MTMQTERIPISEVRPLAANPRRHPERQITELMRSVEQFGQYRPLVIDGEGEVLAGNGLLLAMQRLGMTEVLVYRMKHLNEAQRTKLILADNRLGDLSTDDFEVIEQMLATLDDFEVPGFDPEMLSSLLADAEALAEEADAYGVLDPDVRERMTARGESIGAAHDESLATRGAPPAPLVLDDEDGGVPFDLSTGVPIGDALADAVTARGEGTGPALGHTCPSCGHSW